MKWDKISPIETAGVDGAITPSGDKPESKFPVQPNLVEGGHVTSDGDNDGSTSSGANSESKFSVQPAPPGNESNGGKPLPVKKSGSKGGAAALIRAQQSRAEQRAKLDEIKRKNRERAEKKRRADEAALSQYVEDMEFEQQKSKERAAKQGSTSETKEAWDVALKYLRRLEGQDDKSESEEEFADSSINEAIKTALAARFAGGQ